MCIKLISTGSYASDEIIDNEMLSKMVDTSDEWIVERTGIRTRHISKDLTTEQLAAKSCEAAIEKSGIDKSEIGLLIVATVSGDTVVPASSFVVSELLDIKNCVCFDLNAACSGFIYSLTVANSLMKSLGVKYAAIIGAEKLSKIVDWTDRATCILFGDGAGCAILENTELTEGNTKINSQCNLELVGTTLGGAFDHKRNLTVSRRENMQEDPNPFISMNGRQIYKFATHVGVDVIDKLIADAGISKDEIDFIVPHQANSRIVDTLAEKSGIDKSKWFINLDKYGNTSAASAPLAMSEAFETYDFSNNKGKYILSLAFGGGLSYGGVLFKIV